MNRRLETGFWTVFAAGALFRLFYIGSDIIDLAGDESYYWQWSRNLDWAYYSKGPMVAWLIRLGTEIAGPTEFGVRLMTAAVSPLTLVVCYLLYKRMYPGDGRGLLYMALFFNAAPLLTAGSMIATIDAPLCLAWMTGALALRVAADENRPWGWVLLALAIGFGLLSKYTMFLFLPGVLLYLAASPRRRGWLLVPHPWLALLGGLLFLTPILYWNIQHDWVTWRHNAALGRLDETVTPLKWLDHFGSMVLTQAGLISPVLFIMLAIAAAYHFRRAFGRRDDSAAALLISMALPVLAFYTLLAFKRSIHGNWLAAAYPPLILAAARYWSLRRRAGGGRTWIRAGLALGMFMVVLTLFSDLIHIAGAPGSAKLDPSARVKGWEAFGDLAREAAAPLPDGTNVFFFGSHYQTSSQLAFNLPGQPKTYCASGAPLENQYDVWGGSSKLTGWNAVYAARSKPPEFPGIPDFVRDSFERVEPAGNRVYDRFGTELWMHSAWRCYGFKGWAIPTELEALR